jgi:GNAT superfamily N-acetyltransferase
LSTVSIRAAGPGEFETASEFWVAMRRELGMPDADLAPDWKARSVAYFRRRHDAGELRWFLAHDGDLVVASAAGFLLDGFPSEICTNRRAGYIAGVYVDPMWRRRGLARAVTQVATDWLWSIGCRFIRLHAADGARAIYERLGFESSNELIMKRPPDP